MKKVFWILAALPGVDTDQVQIQIEEGGWLVLIGHRSPRQELRDGAIHILEIPNGPFERRVRLPDGMRFVLGEKRLDHGILYIELKKAP